MTKSPTKTNQTPVIIDEQGRPNLIKGDTVFYTKFGSGTVTFITADGRRAFINFDDHGERQIVIAFANLTRSLRPKSKNSTKPKAQKRDKVEVSFVYRGRQVETRVCDRPLAEKLGKQLVQQYKGMFDGHYQIRELPLVTSTTKPYTMTKPKKVKPKIKVTHYFIEVA